MKLFFYLPLLFILSSCYSVRIQEGQPYNSLSEICDDVTYIKKSIVKREVINCSGSSPCDTIFLMDDQFTYANLLESERKRLNDENVIITNLIWDYKQGLGYLLFRYRRVEAVSFDVIKCRNI
jgi:hypothetical protein